MNKADINGLFKRFIEPKALLAAFLSMVFLGIVFPGCRSQAQPFPYSNAKNEIVRIEIVQASSYHQYEHITTIPDEAMETFLNEFEKIPSGRYLFGDPMSIGGVALKLVYQDETFDILTSSWSDYYDGTDYLMTWRYCNKSQYAQLIKQALMNSPEHVTRRFSFPFSEAEETIDQIEIVKANDTSFGSGWASVIVLTTIPEEAKQEFIDRWKRLEFVTIEPTIESEIAGLALRIRYKSSNYDIITPNWSVYAMRPEGKNYITHEDHDWNCSQKAFAEILERYQ